MATTRDLWGPRLSMTPGSLPARRLKEQADLLKDRTEGLVFGEVVEHLEGGELYVSLDAIVPNLDDYRHRLLTIKHPLGVENPDDPGPLLVDPPAPGGTRLLSGITEFEEWLESVLSAPKTHMIIQNLMRYAKNAEAKR